MLDQFPICIKYQNPGLQIRSLVMRSWHEEIDVTLFHEHAMGISKWKYSMWWSIPIMCGYKFKHRFQYFFWQLLYQHKLPLFRIEIGRASCRERVEMAEMAKSLK